MSSHLSVLGSLGVDVLGSDPRRHVETHEVLSVVIDILERPSDRSVGAALQGLKILGSRDDLLPTLQEVALNSPQKPLRRLGYLADRAGLHELGNCVWEFLEPFEGEISLSGRMRKRDLRRERDEANKKWGVL